MLVECCLGFLVIDNVVIVLLVGVGFEVCEIGVSIGFGIVLVLLVFVVEYLWQNVFFLVFCVKFYEDWVEYEQIEWYDVWGVGLVCFFFENVVLDWGLGCIVIFFWLSVCELVFFVQDGMLVFYFCFGQFLVFVYFSDYFWRKLFFQKGVNFFVEGFFVW